MRTFLRVLGRIFSFLLVTVLMVVVILYGAIYVLCKGPSPTIRDLFVHTVQETSAIGFLAELHLSQEEVDAIMAKDQTVYVEEMDTSLISIPTKPAEDAEVEATEGSGEDEWGLVDEDGDGIIVEQVKGAGFSGFMMVVLDPSRVTVGCKPQSFGARGYTVEQMVGEFDAVAGINAGGFEDPDGKGNGSIPDSMVVCDGKVYYAGSGTRDGFVGFDENNIMHVGSLTPQDVKEKKIRCGVSFGPVLLANGVKSDSKTLSSGINPRTAIGQRSDGAVLLLVIDGRQAISYGATYEDLADLFLEYGAVNACNLDGGSSTLMWYQGGYINNCASVIGIRPVPTAFVVLKEEVQAGA